MVDRGRRNERFAQSFSLSLSLLPLPLPIPISKQRMVDRGRRNERFVKCSKCNVKPCVNLVPQTIAPAPSHRLTSASPLKQDVCVCPCCRRIAGTLTDAVGDMGHLSALGFDDGTAMAIYASHVLEHAHHPHSPQFPRVDMVLRNWRRTLAPGGVLGLSVPNFATIAALYFSEDKRVWRGYSELTVKTRLLSILFWGQANRWDNHYMAFDFSILEGLLTEAGFCDVQELPAGWGLFDDTSTLQVLGKTVSLDVFARAC